jgi:hypothetical protein
MTSLRDKLWNKITRKSGTKPISTLPTSMKIAFIEISILSKEDKL